MWIAGKLIFAKNGNGGEAEDLAEDFLNDLVSRNMNQVARRTYDGRISSCRVHDLLHSFCVDLAEESNFFHTEHNAFGVHGNVSRVRRITFYSDINAVNEFFSSNPKPKKLRVVFYFTIPCIISQMAHLDFKLLQVLVVLPQKYYVIPKKFGNMSCLRYLRLEEVFSRDLPSSILKLKRLETLDFGKSFITIPSGVWGSKQLRHLCCKGFYQASSGCFSISPKMYVLAPNNLQTLTWIDDEFFKLRLLHGLRKLRKQGIRGVSDSTVKILSTWNPVQPALEVLKLDFSRDPYEQIKLSSYPNTAKLHMGGWGVRPLNIEALPPNLVKLTLVDVWVDHHLLAMLKKFPKLRILKMVRCFHNQEKMDLSCKANGDSFPQLEVLHIKKLFDLSQVTCRDDISMPKLNKVILVRVPAPIELPERLAKLPLF